MVGYFEAPELTAAAFDADGYYHTGDLGEIDADRYLHLRGRKRDLFNSSEGTNIYPARIEEMIEGLPWVGQAFLVGDALPFITALIVPRDAPGGAGVLDPEREAERYARARAGLAELNARLEGFERVRRFLLLAGPFDEAVYKTVGASKIRRDRKKLAERHAAEVARLYQADGDPRITVDVKPAGSG
jgi:long-chain acyl-CoA synthetase